MKSTIKTLVVAVVLGTASVAASAELSSVPVSPAEQTDTRSATAAISAVPFHALNRLDAQTLAAQEMTDQELKAVEGGAVIEWNALAIMIAVTIVITSLF